MADRIEDVHASQWEHIATSVEGVTTNVSSYAKEWDPLTINLYIPSEIIVDDIFNHEELLKLGGMFDTSPAIAFEVLTSIILMAKRGDGGTFLSTVDTMITAMGFQKKEGSSPLAKSPDVPSAGQSADHATAATQQGGKIPDSSKMNRVRTSGTPASGSPWKTWFSAVLTDLDPSRYLTFLDGLFCTLCLMIKFDLEKYLNYLRDKLTDIAISKGCSVLKNIPKDKDTFSKIKENFMAGSQLMSLLYAVLVAGVNRTDTSGLYHALCLLRLSGYGTITVQLCIQACASLGISIAELFRVIMCDSFLSSAMAIQKYILILNKPDQNSYWKTCVMLGRMLGDIYFNNLSMNKHPKLNFLSARIISCGGVSLGQLSEGTLTPKDKSGITILANILHEKFGSLKASKYSSEFVQQAVAQSDEQDKIKVIATDRLEIIPKKTTISPKDFK